MSDIVALSCAELCKSFVIFDTASAWKLALGIVGAGARFKALDRVSIDVPKGRFVGIVGRNGAGKSTLLRTLGGVYTPDSGTVDVQGTVSGLYELGLASNRELTGHEYASRVLEIHGLTGARLAAAVADTQEFSELGGRFEDPLFTYSSGMAARLFFATATSVEFDVYLIDEVLAVGDEHFQQKCWRRIRERQAHGASGLLVTHDWSAVLKICERAHILDKGRIVQSGTSADIVRDYLDVNSLWPLQPHVARFVEPVPKRLQWALGDEVELELDAEVLVDNVPVHFTWALESVGVGAGWEIILNGVDLQVASRRGSYRLRLKIPSLPVAPGAYQLSVDLVAVSPGDRLDRTELDGRGWLKGTPIAVQVAGEAQLARANLPLEWRIENP